MQECTARTYASSMGLLRPSMCEAALLQGYSIRLSTRLAARLDTLRIQADSVMPSNSAASCQFAHSVSEARSERM